ncbi:MAG: hypothetical protein IJ634_03875 [Bacteroidales bacterium]|nr:hypothetical protein [Bacteroidales bacterium]
MGEVSVNFNYTKPAVVKRLARKYLSFCQEVIPHRATLMIEKLKQYL